MREKRKDKVVCYTYIKPINKKFLLKKSKDFGYTISEIMDVMIDSIRRNKEFELTKKSKFKYMQKWDSHQRSLQERHDRL